MVQELRDLDVNEPEEVEEPSAPETEAVEEPVEEPEKVEAEPQEEIPQPVQAEEEPKPSRRENERVRDLVAENKRLQQEMETFKTKQSEAFESGEMTYADLNREVTERALEAARLLADSKEVGRELQNHADKWATDLSTVIGKYPQLDSKSPEYDANLSDSIAQALGNPDGTGRLEINPSQFVESIMGRVASAATKAKEEGKSQATATLAKQLNEGALTPTAKVDSEPTEYTDEQLAEMRMKNPQKYLDIIDKID